MLDICSLQSLFSIQTEATPHAPSLDQAVNQFLENGVAPSAEIIEEEGNWQETLMSVSQILKNWKKLLTLNLLCHFTQIDPLKRVTVVRHFERQPWNQSSQYFRSLVALNHALTGMPVPEVGQHVLESGVALIDLNEYSPWLALPYTPYHLEFGIFLCLLALLTKRQELQETVVKMARWQLNTLDAEALPLSGLFTKEAEGNVPLQLLLSYLFFRGAAFWEENVLFESAAQAALKRLSEIFNIATANISPLWVLIEKFFDQHKPFNPSSAPFSLAESINDLSTALVGYRSPSQHAVCTLHGGQTGLGTIRQQNIEIVNYGPQYFPLEECKGFGIEGNIFSDHGVRRSSIETKEANFILKGCTRLVDQPTVSLIEKGHFRGIWMEVKQEFKLPHFFLETTFLGLDGWETIAFSFFVKAPQCVINSTIKLLPKTLEHYEGEVEKICFESEQGKIELLSPHFKGKIQVIPLSGGCNFWGADFLVAYLLEAHQKNYQWQMNLISKATY